MIKLLNTMDKVYIVLRSHVIMQHPLKIKITKMGMIRNLNSDIIGLGSNTSYIFDNTGLCSIPIK